MKLIKIEETGKEFKNVLELREYCVSQFNALKSATHHITRLEEEVKHLQKLLGESIPVIQKIVKSTEELICEAEIEKLYKQTEIRSLELEEVKILDLLVKNLNVAREKNIKALEAEKRNLDSDEMGTLIALASDIKEVE